MVDIKVENETLVMFVMCILALFVLLLRHSYQEAQLDLNFGILLPYSSQFRDYESAPPCLAFKLVWPHGPRQGS